MLVFYSFLYVYQRLCLAGDPNDMPNLPTPNWRQKKPGNLRFGEAGGCETSGGVTWHNDIPKSPGLSRLYTIWWFNGGLMGFNGV